MRETGVIPGRARDVVKGRVRASLLLITGLFLGTNESLLSFLGTDGLLLLFLGTDELLFLGTGFLFSFCTGERGVERGHCFGRGSWSHNKRLS